jgi:hypothetical protein
MISFRHRTPIDVFVVGLACRLASVRNQDDYGTISITTLEIERDDVLVREYIIR